ncbi:MAG TPA: ATP-binding cassette domain-containing protein [Dehalococcoidales bacterium]|nr:ATP-binding cassette domain-containing protein [Dehalococcoidales bacterium]
MIKFEDVSIAFNGKNVLNRISFEIKSHESVAILGPSGSGKTTILKLIAGTLKPDSGRVEVRSQRIGYVFQDYRLLPWRTALDNVALVLKASIADRTKVKERAIGWMRLMRLQGYYNYYPRQLSGGMVQRVAIARALAIEPEVLLMDEPFSSLDNALADMLLRQLKDVLANYRTTTVYVSHDIVGALSVAQRLFVLSREGLKEYPITDRRQMLQLNLETRLKSILGT